MGLRQPAQTLIVAAIVVSAFASTDTTAAQKAQSRPARAARQDLFGSWLVTYDVPAFGGAFPVLLSIGEWGVVMETDAPGKFPLGPGFSVILTNGHGAWESVKGPGGFAYVYRKLIYQEDGLTAFGITRTSGSGSVIQDGTNFQATIVVEIADLMGNVLFVGEGTATGSKIRVE